MNIPYRANGIYPSEARLVVDLAKREGIELFLESGIDNGYSTEVWATQLPCEVHSTDLRHLPDTWARLRGIGNLHLYQLYASPFFHTQLLRRPVMRTAAFIDGPKYEEAAALCQELMTTHPHLVFVAIHDALERKPFECITFKKTFSVDDYTGEYVDREAAEYNAKYGAAYPKGPGLLIVERK